MDTQMDTQIDTPLQKPVNLRIIFIANFLKIFACIGFYYAVKSGKLNIDGLGPEIILYTMAGYTTFFAGMTVSILKKNLMALRALIVLDFLSSIPAKAGIGFIVGILSMGLSFSKSVKAYFGE